MTLHYTYHSEHHASRHDRYWLFLLFLGGLFLLFIIGWSLVNYFTRWDGGGERSLLEHELLLVGVCLLALAFLYFTYRHYYVLPRAEEDRYVRIDDTDLRYDLWQGVGEERIELGSIISVERPNIRELHIETAAGQHILPIYLIVDREKQDELLSTLKEIIGARARVR